MRVPTLAPEGAITIRAYADLDERYALFAEGKTNFLLMLSEPGLGKSQRLRAALEGVGYLHVRGGRESAMHFFCDCYDRKDELVVLDDSDDLLRRGPGLQLVQALTETNKKKTLRWGSMTPLLTKRDVPVEYSTASRTCILTNSRRSSGFRALASRASLFYFDPTPAEWYAYCASWVSDQEVLDYVHETLPVLGRLDCRAVTKAIEDKSAGLPKDSWRQHLDVHCGFKNEGERVAWRIMQEPALAGVSRHRCAREFASRTGSAGRTFYRWHAKLMRRLEVGPAARLPAAGTAETRDDSQASKCPTVIRAV